MDKTKNKCHRRVLLQGGPMQLGPSTLAGPLAPRSRRWETFYEIPEINILGIVRNLFEIPEIILIQLFSAMIAQKLWPMIENT